MYKPDRTGILVSWCEWCSHAIWLNIDPHTHTLLYTHTHTHSISFFLTYCNPISRKIYPSLSNLASNVLLQRVKSMSDRIRTNRILFSFFSIPTGRIVASNEYRFRYAHHGFRVNMISLFHSFLSHALSIALKFTALSLTHTHSTGTLPVCLQCRNIFNIYLFSMNQHCGRLEKKESGHFLPDQIPAFQSTGNLKKSCFLWLTFFTTCRYRVPVPFLSVQHLL